MNWILVLLVWTGAGPNDMSGKFMSFATEAECHTQARQDDKRVQALYPGQRYKFQCVDGGAAEVAAPTKGKI